MSTYTLEDIENYVNTLLQEAEGKQYGSDRHKYFRYKAKAKISLNIPAYYDDTICLMEHICNKLKEKCPDLREKVEITTEWDYERK